MSKGETEEERAARYAALEAEARTMEVPQFRRREFFSVGTGLVAGALGFWGFRSVQNQENADGIPKVLRSVHEANETLWRGLHRPNALARTFDPSESSMLRVNGRHGIRDEINVAAWSLSVENAAGERIGTHTLAEIQELPKFEMTVEHKCVEGWSHIVTWGGARFSDFAAWYSDQAGAEFVGMETPDDGYYVGLERATMMHPQTLLAWELQGEPLSQDHGAPLRLATPLKYGIKQIKRIGRIQFTDQQPADYWAERGYDWYSHL